MVELKGTTEGSIYTKTLCQVKIVLIFKTNLEDFVAISN
jgi:hypothetical protein